MYKIYDDCISKEIADNIEKTLLSREYQWNYINHTVHKEVPDPQMSHLLYAYNPFVDSIGGKSLKSDFFYLIKDLFSEIEKNTDIGLQDKILYRVKSTIMFPNAEKQKLESEIHLDFDDNILKRTNLLYYVNDSDGDTILYEDDKKTVLTRVSPKKGKLLLFSGDIPHCSSSPTKSLKRVVINVNVSDE